jgi:hypothetical protein
MVKGSHPDVLPLKSLEIGGPNFCIVSTTCCEQTELYRRDQAAFEARAREHTAQYARPSQEKGGRFFLSPMALGSLMSGPQRCSSCRLDFPSL